MQSQGALQEIQRRSGGDGSRGWSDTIAGRGTQSQGMWKASLEAGKGKEQIFPWRLLKEYSPANNSILAHRTHFQTSD